MALQIQVVGVYTRKQRQWILFRYGYFDFQGGNGVYWEEEKGLSATGTPGETSTIVYEGTEITTYTTSSGKTHIMYKQNDGPWAGIKYGSQTIGDIGCPTAAAATALSGLGYTYTPGDFVKINQNGLTPTINEKLGGKYKISSFKSNVQKQLIIGSLQNGYPVIIHANGSSIYTNSQHYLVFLDISEDNSKIYVATGYSIAKEGWYDIDVALKGVDWWYEIQ